MRPIHVSPPVYLFLCIAIIVLVDLFLPGKTVLVFPWNAVGVVPLALGLLLNFIADRSFRKHKTAVKPLDRTTALITTGVFRVSRHPMYVGFVLILLGIALLMGSLTPFVLVLAFAFFVDFVFIRFEERKLEETFGQAWLEYKGKVRRWV
jgi:protein-S-isoprenylcysteine O-methyltransferase Ste14